tara:strand:+ start:1303 stop:3264 length:1962 start_codon:yes stop_codon:yes gene_type:complete
MPNYLNQNNVIKNIGGFSFFSSGSTAYQPTSSNASTAAQLDINISSSLPTNIINNTTLNPYIRFTVVSGSNRSNGIDQEIIIRFFSSSHIQPKYTSSVDTTNPGYVLIPSRSLYITSSNTEEITIVDVPYTNPTSYSVLASSIHDILTGSSYFIGNSLSASKTSIAEQSEIVSIHYSNYRGAVGTPPTVYTGSGAIPLTSGISVSYTSTGSGALNFTPQSQLHFASSSYHFRLNTEDQNSLELTQGISSSGFTSNSKPDLTLMYFSSSGKIGFNTKNPKDEIDFKANSFKVRSADGKREMQFSNEGKLTTKKFSNSEASESIGSEIILSYTPGTFGLPQKAQVGETIGTINYVDESFNALGTLDKYFKSGSVAQISSTVRKVSSFGAAGDLQFKVNVDPTSPQDTLVSFMDIDPTTHGSTVYFPYGITSNTHITASGNISASGTIRGYQLHSAGGVYPNIGLGTGVITALSDNSIRISQKLYVHSEAVGSGGGHIHATGNITASGDISSSGTITANKVVSDNIQAGWHGSTTKIKILVSDFIPDDIGRPAMIDDTSSGRWLESYTTGKLFASIPIPTGFKATHVHIYGSATSAITVYESNINSKTVTSKGTGNIGTEINITDVTSNTTNYLFLELAQASGEEVYGGYVTIVAI